MHALRGSLAFLAAVLLAATVRAAPPAPDPRERRLHFASAEASSYLVNDWNKFQENYLPLYAGDDDPKTAWTLKTEGIGEWLRVHVTPMAGATKVRLKVRNGYQKTDKLWAANSRAHGLTVVLLPSKKTVDVDLEDKSGWQEIAVEQPAGALEAIELRVRSVYAGKKYDDLCLSDVQVFVTATTPDNPAFEKDRFKKITDWKRERVGAAKMFASKLGQSLPVASQYVGSAGERDPENMYVSKCQDPLCYMREQLVRAAASAPMRAPSPLSQANELARASFAGMTPVRISTRDKRPLPNIDGVCAPQLGDCVEDPCFDSLPLPRQFGYLSAQSLVVTEQSGLPSLADVLALKPPQCHRGEATTFAYVTREASAADGAPGQVRALLLATCGMVQGREGSYPMAQPQLLVYGAEGLLDVIAGPSHAAVLEWDRGQATPKVARARVTTRYVDLPWSFEAATSVATK